MRWILAVIGLSLSIENLGLLSALNLYVLPPLSLASVLLLPFFFFRVRLGRARFILIGFVAWAVLVSVSWLIADFFIQEWGSYLNRVAAFLKQAIALACGLSVYAMARTAFAGRPTIEVMHGWLIGSIPAVLIGCAIVIGTLVSSQSIADDVNSIRDWVLGANVSGAELGRTSGLSNEPSSFGVYLALIVVPALACALSSSSGWRRKEALLGACFALVVGICFSMTFSATSFVVLAVMLVCALLCWRGGGLASRATIVVAAVAGVTLIFFLVPENYLLNQVGAMLDGDPAWIAKFGGTIGPLLKVSDFGTVFGFGLGGTSFHIEGVLPQYMIDPISAVSYDDQINLKGLAGRILAESGLVGAGLFLAILWTSAGRAARAEPSMAWIHACAVFGIFASISLGNIGSFAHPIAWVWLALWDSRMEGASVTERSSSGPSGANLAIAR